ncbi:conserved hypothetical protein [Desulfovibrionales bacterium]
MSEQYITQDNNKCTEADVVSSENKAKDRCDCGSHEQTAVSSGLMMPKVTFCTFILSLFSSALVHLGEVSEPGSDQVVVNIPMFKHTIDILVMLQEKTVNCLTQDETRLLEAILAELRLKFVIEKK